jgi:hypothetical protein
MSNSRRKFLCMDCKVDTGKIGEHYMLADSTWNLIHDSNKGMLCIGCVESRLGRQLISTDFNDSHVNKPFPGKFFSGRLHNRINNIEIDANRTGHQSVRSAA